MQSCFKLALTHTYRHTYTDTHAHHTHAHHAQTQTQTHTTPPTLTHTHKRKHTHTTHTHTHTTQLLAQSCDEHASDLYSHGSLSLRQLARIYMWLRAVAVLASWTGAEYIPRAAIG